jgi:hypothetical protein
MLEFGKNVAGQFDTHITGLGLDVWVSEVENTELKTPKVSKNIPTVAEFTQVRTCDCLKTKKHPFSHTLYHSYRRVK